VSSKKAQAAFMTEETRRREARSVSHTVNEVTRSQMNVNENKNQTINQIISPRGSPLWPWKRRDAKPSSGVGCKV